MEPFLPVNSWFSSTCPRFLEMIDKQILESTLAHLGFSKMTTALLCVLGGGGKFLVTRPLRCTKITTSENGARILVCIRIAAFET